MTLSMSYICKQVIPLILFRSKAVKYITVLFRQIMRRRSPSMSVTDIVSNSSGTEFVVNDGDILKNFWWLKAMNIGF